MKKILLLAVPLMLIGALAAGKGVEANYADFEFSSLMDNPNEVYATNPMVSLREPKISIIKPPVTPKKIKVTFDAIKRMSTGASVSGSYSQFENIMDEASYLGYGYNVISSPYMDKDYVLINNPILDEDLFMENAKFKLVKENRTMFNTEHSSSMEEFAQDYGASLNVYGNYTTLFTGGLKADYRGSQEKKTFYSFYKAEHTFRTFDLHLVASNSVLKSMLNDEFREILNGNCAPGVLFEQYGTHLITAAAMGGRIDFSTTYSSSETGYSNEANAAVEAHVNYLGSSIHGEIDASYQDKLSAQNITEKTKVRTLGGHIYDMSTAALAAEKLEQWSGEIENDMSISALVGLVGQQSLVPLWDLVDDDNQARKDQLEAAFVNIAGESYADLCSMFQLSIKRYVSLGIDGDGYVNGLQAQYQDGDTVELTAGTNNQKYKFDGWYVGGTKVCSTNTYSFVIHANTNVTAKFTKDQSVPQIQGIGTKADPYIINQRNDFNEMKKDMNAYYKLGQNIDFGTSTWTPIPGVFRGHLDGNGRSISNLRISRSATTVNSALNLGLFEEIGNGGEVSNLTITTSYVTVSEGDYGSANINAGLFCGINNGIIKDCVASRSTVTVKRVKACIGMIAGANLNAIANCILVTNTISGYGYIGGVAGYVGGTGVVEYCTVSNSGYGDTYISFTSKTSNRACGGICGLGEGCTIRGCRVEYTHMSLAGDMSLVPAIGIIVGYQLSGSLIGNPNLSGAVFKSTTDSKYKTCYFAVSWGICGRVDYSPYIS